MVDEIIDLKDNGVTVVRTKTGNVLHKIEGSSDPAAWMLDNPDIPRTPKKVHRDGCYICEDDEFARMGLPLCYLCPSCKIGHIAADDVICDDCGFDIQEASEEERL